MATGQYKRLLAILDTTKARSNPLYAELNGDPADLILRIADSQGQVLATAPFDPENPDAAAEDVARRLTLDGGLPPGMGAD